MVVIVLLLAMIVGGAILFTQRARTGNTPPGPGAGTVTDARDAEVEAHSWVDRLGGGLSTLEARGSRAAAQSLADAAERHRAAQAQLATAYGSAQYALVVQTATEGLHHLRAARTALGLDPGPELPTPITVGQGGTVTVDGRTYTPSAAQGATTPYYFPGGTVAGRTVPGGWYSTPWWKTALVAGAAGFGGLLLADSLLNTFHHGGPGFGGPGGHGMGGGPGGFF
ncbi:hypothetical protein [Streptomyces paludis]|uniref:DUF1542 domain-containing protein n=1 Tax=Streptomyces paludis TaxID=2282738 RepID=A0A345HMV8_9ACTN|nr:hypothetical protein [Streptomyces paludis]AXG78032.1 hypothetical protein DVK44_10280 [Streptomyces paludis]